MRTSIRLNDVKMRDAKEGVRHDEEEAMALRVGRGMVAAEVLK